jgi:trans-aconitate methyltransferase
MRYSGDFHKRRIGDPKYAKLASAALVAFKTATGATSPVSILDVGCSVGALLQALGEQAPKAELTGFDHNMRNIDQVFSGTYMDVDLNKPGSSPKTGDLIISQEVLEHVEPENNDKALQFLCSLGESGSCLVFGAAHVGQPGRHHVNCKDLKEWESLLRGLGWRKHKEATDAYREKLIEQGITKGCYLDNTQVYIKE